MSEITEHFIAKSRSYLSEIYLPKIERCVEGLSVEDVWWRAGEESNSIGNLLLHLEGSTRMWIVSGVGGAPDVRLRQEEFDARETVGAAELVGRLRETVAEADGVLASVERGVLLERRRIREVETTVLGAIYHAVEHFSMHAGQIFMLAKMRAGRDLKLYD
jgi:uncharacterized damage-inducible protein DinB